MIRLLDKIQSHIVVFDEEIPINTGAEQAIFAWNAFQEANDGNIKPLTAIDIAYEYMLNREFDYFNADEKEVQEVVKQLMEYFHKYARSSDREKNDNKPPLICFEQDKTMIHDAFLLLGVNLYEIENLTYPIFMAKLRLLQTTEAPLCRIIYLRQLIRDNKIGKKEYKSEREEIKKIGYDVVMIKPRMSKKEREEVEQRRDDTRKRFANVSVQ